MKTLNPPPEVARNPLSPATTPVDSTEVDFTLPTLMSPAERDPKLPVPVTLRLPVTELGKVPGGPVAPEAPVAPEGPVTTDGRPALPGAPVGPEGPVTFEGAPVGPDGPVTFEGAPVGPDGPVTVEGAPDAPVGPVRPVAPVVPTKLGQDKY